MKLAIHIIIFLVAMFFVPQNHASMAPVNSSFHVQSKTQDIAISRSFKSSYNLSTRRVQSFRKHKYALGISNGRYLDTDSGTFTQVDPMQDGTNWYTYVGGDPVNNRDPSGYTPAKIANLGFIALDATMLVKNSIQANYYSYTGEQEKAKIHLALSATWGVGLAFDIASLPNPLDPGGRPVLARVGGYVAAKIATTMNHLHGTGSAFGAYDEVMNAGNILFNDEGFSNSGSKNISD